MRAYRARLKANHDTHDGAHGNDELFDRIKRVTAERDALQVEVNELRGRVRDLETTTRRPTPPATEPPTVRPVRADSAGQPPLSRAERRRLEREQRRRTT